MHPVRPGGGKGTARKEDRVATGRQPIKGIAFRSAPLFKIEQLFLLGKIRDVFDHGMSAQFQEEILRVNINRTDSVTQAAQAAFKRHGQMQHAGRGVITVSYLFGSTVFLQKSALLDTELAFNALF